MGIPVNEENIRPGENNITDRVEVAPRYLLATISSATTVTIKSGSGLIGEIRVIGGTLGAIQIFDNTSATGTVLLPSVTPVAGGVLLRGVEFYTGLTIVTAAATVVVVEYL